MHDPNKHVLYALIHILVRNENDHAYYSDTFAMLEYRIAT
jgi:hypothetical protein